MDPDVRHPADRRTRRPGSEGGQRLRNQWPIPAAGAPSTISGVGLAPVAVAEDTVHLGMLALYAATGNWYLIAGYLAVASIVTVVGLALGRNPQTKEEERLLQEAHA